MESKIPCLFGFHIFDERWQFNIGTFYGFHEVHINYHICHQDNLK